MYTVKWGRACFTRKYIKILNKWTLGWVIRDTLVSSLRKCEWLGIIRPGGWFRREKSPKIDTLFITQTNLFASSAACSFWNQSFPLTTSDLTQKDEWIQHVAQNVVIHTGRWSVFVQKNFNKNEILLRYSGWENGNFGGKSPQWWVVVAFIEQLWPCVCCNDDDTACGNRSVGKRRLLGGWDDFLWFTFLGKPNDQQVLVISALRRLQQTKPNSRNVTDCCDDGEEE